MDASHAEIWFHYGTTDAEYQDFRFAAHAILRIYEDGSTVWKTRNQIQITPCIWDEVPDPRELTHFD